MDHAMLREGVVGSRRELSTADAVEPGIVMLDGLMAQVIAVAVSESRYATASASGGFAARYWIIYCFCSLSCVLVRQRVEPGHRHRRRTLQGPAEGSRRDVAIRIPAATTIQ